MPNDIVPNRLVAALVYEGLATFEFGIAAEVFGLARPEAGPGWYRFVPCAVEPGPLRAEGGLYVSAPAGLEALADAGTIVVPGWPVDAGPPDARLVGALRDAAARGARILSICTGAFLLAAAGLLDGRRATTHWRFADRFRQAFPDVELLPGVLYVDEGNLLTSAGSAAGIDLLLHVVRTDFGAAVANGVARRLVVPAHRNGGQAQFIERPVAPRPDGRLAPMLDRMREALTEPMTIASLARDAAMSERTFLRRFREMTGTTPSAWLLDARIEAAKQFLEVGQPTETVAAAAGFGSAATMRMHFRNRVGISPSEYRQRFAGDRGSTPQG